MVAPAPNGEWLLTVQGRIYESPDKSPGRQMLIDKLAAAAGARRHDPLYRERAGWLVSDSKRNVRIGVVLGARTYPVPASDAAGFFRTSLALSEAQVAQLAHAGAIAFESAPGPRHAHRYRGKALVVPAQGITVVTDMDDTIKETQVLNRSEAKANTFVHPFRAVDGMPELFRAWQAAHGAAIHFHVVSAGPWQFHEPLRRFTEQAGFPDFTWDMRALDIMNPAIALDEIVKADPQRLFDFKLRALRALIERLPQRRYVLVGDSGEQDPQVYAAILAQFPQQIDAIYIRDVTGESHDAPRYRALYAEPAARAKLTVFRQPTELPQRLPIELAHAK